MYTFGSCSDSIDHSSGPYEKEQEKLNQNTKRTAIYLSDETGGYMAVFLYYEINFVMKDYLLITTPF